MDYTVIPSFVIVDDSRLVRNIVRRMIGQLYYRIVAEATDGLDLFRQLDCMEAPPDVCLLDIEMPHMDGFETAMALRRLYPDIRILAYSSNASATYIDRIMACGADAFLSKESDLRTWKKALICIADRGII